MLFLLLPNFIEVPSSLSICLLTDQCSSHSCQLIILFPNSDTMVLLSFLYLDLCLSFEVEP